MSDDTEKNGPPGGAFENRAYTSVDEVKVKVTAEASKVIEGTIPQKAIEAMKIDTRFGYGPCKPRFLQIFNKIPVLVVFLIIFCFVEGFAINGIANAGLPGIERQFQLTSSKSSLIPASQDIGALVVTLFVSYIGGRHNKLVCIAIGSLIMAVGSFIFIIPHLAEKYNYQGSSGPSGPSDECGGSTGGDPPPCNSDGTKYVGVFMASQIVHGLGFTPMFSLGTVYLDENSTPQMAAVYLGLCYAAAAVGVATGFFVGGEFMQNWFVDFDRVDQDTLGFDAMDTRWVGAWWLGFVFTSILFVVLAIPLFGYPKYMPGNIRAAEIEAGLQKDKGATCGRMVLDVLKGLVHTLWKLLKNPTFVFITLAGCAEALIIFGTSAFSFKYLAEMYNMGFDDAGLFLGGLILFGSLGMFLGGLLIRIFRLEIVGMLRLNVIATMIACIVGVAYIAKCPEMKLAGHQVTYPQEIMINGFSSGCNNQCFCDQTSYNPVCGKDGIVYYSACHAGCSSSPSEPMMPYTNCSCVASSLNITADLDSTATSGVCDDGCTNIRVLGPCLFIMMISVLIATTPTSMAILRCVEEDTRAFALGVSDILLRLLGSIPGPVLIGSIIDDACSIWGGGVCDSPGPCLMYSKEKLSTGVLLWWVIVSGVASVLFFIASLFASRLTGKGSDSYDMEQKK